MRFLFILLFLPLFSFAQTTAQLSGLWVKDKAGVNDGNDGFLKYNFTDDGFVDRSNNPIFNEYRLSYKLHDDTLRIVGVLFHVVNMRPDTLVMSLENGTKKVVYILLKVHDLKIPSEVMYDHVLKDSVYKANSLLFPQCNSRLYDFLDAINAKPDSGELKISFIVTKKGRIKSYTTLGGNTVSKDLSKLVNETFESLEWSPARINYRPVNCLVTINLHFKKVMMLGRARGYLGIDFPFLTAVQQK